MVTNVPPSVPPSAPPPPAVGPPQRARRRPSARAIVLLVLIAAAIWFIAVNTREQKVTLWIPTVEAPTWLVLLVTILTGIVVGFLARRRQRARTR